MDHLTLSHLPVEQAGQVRSILKQLDSMWNEKLGEINTVEHHIDLVPNARAVMICPFCGGSAAHKEIEKEVQRMRDQEVIEPLQ